MLDELYNDCKADKIKLIINGAGNAKCEKVNSNLYWEKVMNFITKYID